MNPCNKPGRFHWLDFAAVDAGGALSFYEGMFGWRARRHSANGGAIYRLAHDGKDVASLYQLGPRHVAGGVPPHWTPYIAVSSADEAACRAEALGGRVVVRPFDVQGMARVSLIDHPAGGLFGLWEVSE
jgi:predicted enzyme related to lactoylglutathione lyase